MAIFRLVSVARNSRSKHQALVGGQRFNEKILEMRNKETGRSLAVGGRRPCGEGTAVSLANRSGTAKVTLQVNQTSVGSLGLHSASNK